MQQFEDPRNARSQSPRQVGAAPGILVGAAIAVALVVGVIAGLVIAESRDDDPEEAAGAVEEFAALDEAAEDAPPCTEMFAPGRPVADVLADNEAGPCVDAGGEPTINGVSSWECPDGTKVHQVGNLGWGRDGGVWQGPEVPEPYADCVLPGTDAQHP